MSRHAGTAIEAVAHAGVVPASDRSFAWLLVGVATALAAYAHWKALAWVWWPIAIGAVLVICALVAPRALAPLNRAWMALGLLLGRIVTPVIMGAIYFGILTPIAWVARRRGVDPMRRNFDHSAKSYWIERTPPGPDPRSMERQF
jgi:hypothetical protein